MKVSLKETIKNQLETSSNKDEASWNTQSGVVISENQAKEILHVISGIEMMKESVLTLGKAYLDKHLRDKLTDFLSITIEKLDKEADILK